MDNNSELAGLRHRREINEIEYDIVKPFGPSILETQLPDDIFEALLSTTDELLASSGRESWGAYLVGQIREEIRIPDAVLEEIGVADYLKQVFAEFSFGSIYCNAAPDYKKEVDKLVDSGEFRNPARIDIESAWVVSQFAGEYNPIHNHSMATIASVMYLKVPDKMEGSALPGKQPTDGCIEFVDRAAGDSLATLQTSTVRVRPQAGRFYAFPSSLLHLVYPFQGEGERRSISINASHRF
ncbi:MAG: putative 2OG-Fe(II) oxygenase [Pseudomonadota bacterium]